MEELIQQIANEQERRLFGKYRGVVADNEDPKKQGRLRLKVSSLFGNDPSNWALPCLPFGGKNQQGIFFIPEIDSRVWVEFEEGDISRPIWTGVFWQSSDDLPDDAAKTQPTTRVIKTPSGHTLQFDDADGERQITLTHPNEADLIFKEDGSIELSNAGMAFELSQERNELLVEDTRGNRIRFNDNGWSAEDLSGSQIEMTGGSITVNSNNNVTINAASVNIGGANGEPVIKGLSFLSKYMSHTHTVAPIVGGPTSPPIPQGEFDSLSTKVTSS